MKDIIAKRPKGMSYEKYRKERKAQQRALKKRVKHGRLVYLSVQYVKVRDSDDMVRHTYPPAIRTTNRRGEIVYKPMERKELK